MNKIRFCLIALLVAGLSLEVASLNSHKNETFYMNLEALSEPEAFAKGHGDCYDSEEFSLNVLYLDCDAGCRYYYGVPIIWTKSTCGE